MSETHMESGGCIQDKQKKDLFWEKNKAKEMETSLEWFSRLQKWLYVLPIRKRNLFPYPLNSGWPDDLI